MAKDEVLQVMIHGWLIGIAVYTMLLRQLEPSRGVQKRKFKIVQNLPVEQDSFMD